MNYQAQWIWRTYLRLCIRESERDLKRKREK
jgi:hypothetical protein